MTLEPGDPTALVVTLCGVLLGEWFRVVALATGLAGSLQAPVALTEVSLTAEAVPEQGGVGPVEWSGQCYVVLRVPVGGSVDLFSSSFFPRHDFLLSFVCVT